MLIFDWRIGLIVAVVSILIMVISRYVSLGSVAGGIVYPAALAAFMAGSGSWNGTYLTVSHPFGYLVIVKHHANIRRLLSGTENKLFSKKNKAENQ